MVGSLSTPKFTTALSSPTLQTLIHRHRRFSTLTLTRSPFIINPLSSSSSYSFNLSKKALGFLSDDRLLKSRRFSTRAESMNGAEPRHYDFDLFTIGAGSGGVRASRFAANFGASVAVCELLFATISSDSTGGVGGTCLLRGCVPKKLLVYGSKYSHEFEESLGFEWSYNSEPTHDWSTLMANKNAELQRLTDIYKNILNNDGVKLIEGREMIRDFVAEQMSLKGIEFHPEESPQAVIKSTDGLFSIKTNKGTIEGFSHVMFATGRKPNTKNLGLENVGVELDKNGAILVDEYSRTSVPSIWAVGDVTDRMNLTLVA